MLQFYTRLILNSIFVLFITSCNGFSDILLSDGDVTSLAWSRDGKILAVGSAEGTLYLWDISKNEISRPINVQSSIVSLVWSPVEDVIAIGTWSDSDQSTITLWDVNSGKSRKTVGVPTPKLKTLSWSPNGVTLSAGISKNSILIWDIDTDLVRTLESFSGEVFSLAWSPSGNQLAAGSQDGSLALLNSSDFEPTNTFTYSAGNYVTDIAWSPDGQSLASASCFVEKTLPGNCRLILWYPSSNEYLMTVQGGVYDFTSISWSPTGKFIASAFMNGDVVLYSTDSGQRIRTLRTPIGWTVVSWSPDGKTLAAGSEGGSVSLWNIH